MARIGNPVTFSRHFGVDAKLLRRLGLLNPSLNLDTKLFVDPMLLAKSKHPEISIGGRSAYQKHFERVIKLLRASKEKEDVAWRSARQQLSFPEIKWTCLGYGSQSIAGSGSGTQLTGQALETAAQIVELGVDDPDLFAAMALFEEGIGPDRISDMTASVILGPLLALNERVLAKIPVPTERVELDLPDGRTYTPSLPINPYDRKRAPIILVPRDILRHLPIATDWSDVADAAAHNSALRNRVNRDIANLWESKTLKDKGALRRWALSSRGAFEDLLQMLQSVNPVAYDFSGDPKGELFWRDLIDQVAVREPMAITRPPKFNLDGVDSIVKQIIEQFRFLIEDRRFSEELYHRGVPRPEHSAQMLFFAVASSYCKANDLDLTPEADTGNGPVDFKVSSGHRSRVLVEIKLSTNTKVVPGYTRQLEAYKRGEETGRDYYVVLDVGKMGKKRKELEQTRAAAVERGEKPSQIVFIDGARRPSASHL